jgi:photosystem II stability/assembly factor-like uncharacterized protein
MSALIVTCRVSGTPCRILSAAWHVSVRFFMAPAVTALMTLTLHFSPAVSAGSNQWTSMGPDGADIVALAIDQRTPSSVLAGTRGAGILRSRDSGATWVTANSGLPTANTSALAIDPSAGSIGYAGTDTGVFKTVDGGEHWVAINTDLGDPSQIGVNAISIDPHSPATVYAGTSKGLFRTTDGGASWSPIALGMPGLVPHVVTLDAASPSTIYVGVDDTLSDFNYGVLRSTDAGASWTSIYRSTPYGDGGAPSVIALLIDPAAPSHLYLALAFDQVLKSLDGGATWVAIKLPEPLVTAVAADAGAFATLYVATYSGALYRSVDAGEHWTPAGGGPPAGTVNVIAMPAPPSQTVYVGAGNGIFQSVDSGGTWKHLALGVRAIGVYAFAVDPAASSTLYASAAGVIAKTTDGGAHWNDANFGIAGQGAFLIAIDPASPATLYASVAPPNGQTPIYKSIDAALHWLPTGAPTRAGLQALAIAPSRPSTLFIGVNFSGVLKSTDGGASWMRVSNGLTAVGPYVSALAVDPTDFDTVYAATPPTGQPNTEAKVFKSTDGAGHWQQLPLALPAGVEVTALAIDPVTPSNVFLAYAYGSQGEGGVQRSSDGGRTWNATQRLSGVPVRALAIDPGAPSRIYAATGAGVFRSTDEAMHWAPLNGDLPSLEVFSVAIDRTGTLLRAATAAGLYEYRFSEPSTPGTVAVVEYYHGTFGHYFITAIPDEIAKLDGGFFTGWTRTGYAFRAYAAPTAETSPVCRFLGIAFAPQSSHFYSPFAFECSTVAKNPQWQLESSSVFRIAVPAPDGSCAAGLLPVFRLFNNGQGGAPNHRYTTDIGVRTAMTTQGWVPEGLGPDGVQMCAPPT